MMKRFAGTSVIAAVIGLGLAGGAFAEDWKFAIEEIPGSIMDSYAQEFKKRIEAATDGDVTVTIYPLGSLGTPSEVAEQTADGVVQFSNLSVGNLGTIAPDSQFLLTPYLFPNDPEKLNTLLATSKTLHEDMAEDLANKGLHLGALYSEGQQVWTTKREVRSPEDADNFKMRVMVSPLLVTAYEDLGFSPTPVPFGDVYGALQLGQVDGQVNPVPTIEEMKFYENTDYMIWAGGEELITIVMSGEDWYQDQPDERKALIDETFAGLYDFIAPVVAQFNDERLDKIKAAKPDIQMITLTDEERAQFSERAKDTQTKIDKVISPRGAELLESLKAEMAQ
ncbi:MAG: TRAP transporter substrate-binding protein DctP [Rhodobacterales bacterium]|nr:TRAP transporter substrate-binding protein DctP [Rhodobacterales bacterium]